MRLIDADVLFENVGKIKPRNKEHYKSVGEFMNMITYTPTINVKWIPVSERLPSDDGEYIITMGKDSFDKEGNVTWAMFDKLKKGFYFPAGRVNYYVAVTAWMPLPEPYKDGDTECG